MNKSNIILIGLLNFFLLASCWATDTTQTNNSEVSCSDPLTINSWSLQSLNLKARVVADNIKNVTTNAGGNIEYLNCEKGTKVTEKTIIAKVKPDYTDPAVQNLINQSTMISGQIENTREIIASTKNSFSSQLESLQSQKSNLDSQLSILNDSYDKLSEQKDFWVSDIGKQQESLKIQLETLDNQIKDLKELKTKLESSKKTDLAKLNITLTSTKEQVKSMITTALLQIDEIYGISEKNKDKNNAYEDLLWARNSTNKQDVIDTWKQLNIKFQNYDNFSSQEISDYLQSLDDLLVKTKESVKDSISAVNLSDTMINSFYSLFSQFESGSINAKSWIDTILKSIDSVGNNYDSQILNIDIQITTAENTERSVQSNIDNVDSNKLGTYTTSIELQKNQSKSQIETTKTSLATILSQIETLKSQEQIQLNQLNNQLSQLQSSLRTININLNPQVIYAGVNGIVKEKLGSMGNKINSYGLLCQILPNKSSLKLQVYSSYDLPLPLDISFILLDKKYDTQLINKLPYQDAVTQNYIYETPTTLSSWKKTVNLIDISSEGKIFDIETDWGQKVGTDTNTDTKVYIPIRYVINTINGSEVIQRMHSGKVQKIPVTLWELDASSVEIRSGLNYGDTICN